MKRLLLEAREILDPIQHMTRDNEGGGHGAAFRPGWALLLVLLVASGCSDSTGPAVDRYTLQGVDGQTAHLFGPDVVISRGTLEVREDNAVEQRLVLVCAITGQACSIPEGWDRLTGVVDRTPVTHAGDMRIEWADGREALLRLAGDTAWVSHPLPPSSGFVGQVTLRFVR
jgi:hypothetical protein